VVSHFRQRATAPLKPRRVKGSCRRRRVGARAGSCRPLRCGRGVRPSGNKLKGLIMGAVAFVAPFLPGKVEDHRRFCDELVGSRREEYEASRRRLGIKRESAWHQETPAGTVSVVYIEADDPGSACRAWAPRPTRLTNGFGRAFWIFTASTSPTRRDHHPSRFSTTAPNESASRRSLERNVVLCVSQLRQMPQSCERILAASASRAGLLRVQRPAFSLECSSSPRR
jgi:hypothetical protein